MLAREDISEGLVSLGSALTDFGNAIKGVTSAVSNYNKKAASTYYHLVGQYTFPLDEPGNVSSISELGPAQIPLFIIPVIPIAFLSSLTIGPLIGNSIQSFFQGFVHVFNLPLLDMSDDSHAGHVSIFGTDLGNDDRNLARKAYGLPGYLIGGALAAIPASIVAAFRVMTNSFKSFFRMYVSIIDWVLPERLQPNADGIVSENRHPVKKIIVGFPGLVIGAVLGAASALIIAITRGTWNFMLDTIRSMVEAYVTITNLSLVGRPKEEKLIIHTKQENRMARRFTVGLPGLMLGGVLGTASALIVGVSRILWNVGLDTIRSLVESYATVTNLALVGRPEEEKLKITTKHLDRNMARRLTIGLPGLIIGGVFGGISALAILVGRAAWNVGLDFVRSFVEAYVTTTNLGLVGRTDEEKLKINTKHDNRMARRFTLGLPGLLFGAVFGGISALAILITRAPWNILLDSTRSFVEAYVTVTNLALLGRPEDEKLKIITKHEDRMARRLTLGLPGLILGAVLGAASAVLVGMARIGWKVLLDSTRSFVEAYVTVTNLSLVGRPDDEKLTINTKHEDRMARRLTLGLPGLVLGAVFGATSALIVLAARGIWNVLLDSTRSLVEAYVTVSNLALIGRPDDEKLEIITKQENRMARRFTLGLPGLVLGAVFGGISALTILVTRGVWNFALDSTRSFVEAYVTVVNLALKGRPEEERLSIFTKHLDRNKGRRFTLGLPGLILGAVAGVISAIVIGIARAAWNIGLDSIRSLVEAYVTVTNLGLVGRPDEEKLKITTKHEDRMARRFTLGLPGLMIGAVAGAISALAIGIARAAWNIGLDSIRSLVEAYVTVTNVGLAGRPDNEKLTIPTKHEDRMARRFTLGLPGLIIGAIGGAISAIAIGIARAAWNIGLDIVRSTVEAYVTVTNLGLIGRPENEKLTIPTKHENRMVRRFTLGLPGLIIGAVAGAISAIAIAIARAAWNIGLDSLRSFVEAYVTVTNLSLVGRPDNEKLTIPTKHENRMARRFTLGLPGLIVGAVFGGISALAVLIARGAWNLGLDTVRSFVEAFVTVTNLSLVGWQEEDKLKITTKHQDRNKARRFTVGLPGLMLGGLFGAASALLIFAVRGIAILSENTFFSWRALSGSLLNGAGHRSWFEGLGGDDRTGAKKAIGGIGYVLAIVTTAPVALAMYALKNTLLIGFPVIGALIASPFILFAKTMARNFGKPRFENNAANNDEIIQKFKNLYSSLNTFGEFDVNTDIQENADGEDNIKKLLLKSVKLNLNTITEKLLEILLETYQRYQNQYDGGNFFDSNDFDTAVQTAKDRYKVNFLTPQETVDIIHYRIDHAKAFIKNYMQDKATNMPALDDARLGKTWGATFFGGKKGAQLQAVAARQNIIDDENAPLIPKSV